MTRNARPENEMELSGVAYSGRALAAAAAILRGQDAKFAVKRISNGRFAVALISPPPGLPEEEAWRLFLSEALSQECRKDLLAKNSTIPKIMMVQAVISAIGEAGDGKSKKPSERSARK